MRCFGKINFSNEKTQYIRTIEVITQKIKNYIKYLLFMASKEHINFG